MGAGAKGRFGVLGGGAMALADAGTASVATFLASLIALRSLTDEELALYALVFAAMTALMIAPQYLAYIPQRLHANRQQDLRRPQYRADATTAAPYGALTAVGVFLAGAPMLGHLDGTEAYVAICGTAAVLSLLSPFQDHLRASLHVADRHGRAAGVSGLNLAVVAVVLVTVETVDGLPAWAVLAAPFGSLALGNAVSIAAGYRWHRDVPQVEERDRLPVASQAMVASTGFARHGAGYVANLLVAALISPAALAGLEAARVAAQPVLILGTGVASFMMPKAVRAIGAGRMREARRRMGRLVAVVSSTGVVYALLLLPFSGLVSLVLGRPVDAPLASARAGAYSLSAAANPFNAYAMAERRYGLALTLTLTSELVALGVLVAAIPAMGVFAVPLAGAVSAILRIGLHAGYRWRAASRPESQESQPTAASV
ncbi:lipopolysaccharide biosynthesis protein [Demequina zhanjiangensis]|uniref:Membrane protein involved in the export of O-antigen and teichoic acid n=1 Tax=Demequina zhanjiangensis TaxID=3051659 RepID=A0ABT8FZA6_9MICO|nr:hypothetical protein [Demequina sp. SYSU T00b26]MDN4472044.1 hypothetical protein [Demequina sp. SYSU T00b26]